MNNKTKSLISQWIFGIACANFLVFWLIAVCLGGDAVNGKIDHGHYYLMSHGDYTEVSKEIFTYSKWHVYSIWITHPLAFIAAYWYGRFRGK